MVELKALGVARAGDVLEQRTEEKAFKYDAGSDRGEKRNAYNRPPVTSPISTLISTVRCGIEIVTFVVIISF